MSNFNNIGYVRNEYKLPRGLIARLTWVWPWRRKTESENQKYLVTVTNPQGIVVYDNCTSDRMLYSEVGYTYLNRSRPQMISLEEEVWSIAFSVESALENYFEGYLSDGEYMIMIPANEKVAKDFWEWESIEGEGYRNCYAIDVSKYQGSVLDVIEASNKKFPGRYFLMVVKDDYIQSTVSLT